MIRGLSFSLYALPLSEYLAVYLFISSVVKAGAPCTDALVSLVGSILSPVGFGACHSNSLPSCLVSLLNCSIKYRPIRLHFQSGPFKSLYSGYLLQCELGLKKGEYQFSQQLQTSNTDLTEHKDRLLIGGGPDFFV